MNLEKLQTLVNVMSNEQYKKFEAAVFNLMKDDHLFSGGEIRTMEKKALKVKTTQKERVPVLN